MRDNKPNQPSKYREKSWVEINDDSHGVYISGSQIRFKMMFKSSLSDYRGAYILLSGTITTDGAGAEAAAKITEKRKKDVTITDYVLFSKCISNINNTKVDDAQELIWLWQSII